jgi:hypothetical protein
LTADAYVGEQGVSEEWVQLLVEMYEAVRSGSLASLTDDVQRVLGRSPRDFSEYARTAAALGAWHN